MVAFREKCPHCGAAHNPLLHLSFRTTPELGGPDLAGRFGDFDSSLAADGSLPADGLDEPAPPEAVTFTYLCDTCGGTYWIESEVDQRSAL